MISKKQGCSCEECIECCKREPGWFLPSEVDIAAAYLKLSRTEFISKFCKEHFEDDTFTISPATKPNSSECIFLNKEGLCKIHPVKPYECRKVMGCEKLSRHRRIRDIIKKQWK